MATRNWTSNGKEQKYLERLLREGKVLPNSKPSDVQGQYKMFEGFSDNVFRKHWSLTKKKFQSGCKYK